MRQTVTPDAGRGLKRQLRMGSVQWLGCHLAERAPSIRETSAHFGYILVLMLMQCTLLCVVSTLLRLGGGGVIIITSFVYLSSRVLIIVVV